MMIGITEQMTNRSWLPILVHVCVHILFRKKNGTNIRVPSFQGLSIAGRVGRGG